MNAFRCARWTVAGGRARKSHVKVRIKRAPREREIDGVNLAILRPGMVREVSAIVGAWLTAEGYAFPEMRAGETDDFGTELRSATDEQRSGFQHKDRRRKRKPRTRS